MIIKPLGAEVAIGSANNISNATLIRVINTGALAQMNVAYANGTVYANVSVSNTESIVIQKAATDTVTGANMKAAPIAFKH
jgi:hypothetical protein